MDDSHREKLAEAFKEECTDLLAELEDSLLSLENAPADPELIAKIFRVLHTIKGSGAMAGFNDISEFTHNLETVYDLVRNGNITVSKRLIDTTLNGKDYIERLLNSPDSISDGNTGESIIAELEKVTGITFDKKDRPKKHTVRQNNLNKSVFYIEFKPPENIFLKGVKPGNILDELKELGDMECIAHIENIPDFLKLNPEQCYISWSIKLTTSQDINAIKDVFIFIEDDSEISINEKPVKSNKISHKPLSKNKEIRPPVKGTKELQQSIRVSSGKLDSLVNLVGEMIIAQAKLSQISKGQSLPELTAVSEEIENLLSELRETVMKLRMIPIEEMFGRFRRLVRDLSDELNKKVELITMGGETELDKNVIDRLQDPIMHIIRNSIDHGIEKPETRAAEGKDETGHITLKASYSGAYVFIEIKDDGAGLDRNKIINTAINRGIISSKNEIPEAEVYNIIFKPGFSTAGRVTDLSGRGVGMDVVKRIIDSLGGSTTVESTPGRETAITLKIPLTLAIIEGMLIRVSDNYYIIPLSAVNECIEYRTVIDSGKKNLISLRGRLIPYIKLRDYFGIAGEHPKMEQMVITQTSDGPVGFVVDEVEGQYQTVIKSLGAVYRGLEGISGATILGNGRVALILDVLKLTRLTDKPVYTGSEGTLN